MASATWGGLALVTILLARPATRAQQAGLPAPGRRTIIQVDLLAPLAENALYNAFNDRRLLTPLLISCERLVAGRWSVGAQGILNNGFPRNHTHGVELLTRCYTFPGPPSACALTGGFVSAQVGYRWVSYDESDPGLGRFTRTGRRLRTTLYGGYQLVLDEGKRAAVSVSASAGLAYWHMLSTDTLPDNLLLPQEGIRLGFLPDVKFEMGVKF